jgi:transcriptional regulator with XRE-family HTH domain
MSRFGQNLRALRERAKLTQDGLAARLGFKKPTPISLWETGTTVPQPRTIEKLAAALECKPADLLVGVVTPYDTLRGSTEVVGTGGDLLRLTDAEVELVRAWRRLPTWQQQYLEEVIDAVAKYARRGKHVLVGPSSPPTPSGSAGPQSANPGRRKRRPHS